MNNDMNIEVKTESPDSFDETHYMALALERAITSCSPSTASLSVAKEAAWTIKRAAQTLITQYYSICMVALRENPQHSRGILRLLKNASDCLPSNIDPVIRQEIERFKSVIMTIPQDIQDIREECDL